MVPPGSADPPGGAARGRPGWSGGRRRRDVPRPPSRPSTGPSARPEAPTRWRSEWYPDDEDAPPSSARHGFTEPPRPRTAGDDGPAPPRKLTVTRVVFWRGRVFTRRAVRAYRGALHADGADRSGLAALTRAVMLNYATDATLAVALANTLFFSAATAESKTKVALYLLVTVAPFALVAPVIGPALDRVQQGRRVALAVSCLGQALAAVVMALHYGDWLLYPAALATMVLSKSFTVLKAAVTPRVLPEGITLVKTNARLTVFGLAASAVFGALAAGLAKLSGSPGALWFTAVLAVVDAALCLRIPSWVEVTEGEVATSLRARPRRPRRTPMGGRVLVALCGNGTIRLLTGFLTLFAAFVVKAQTEHSPLRQVLLLGMIGAAAGIGNFLGNAVGARVHFGRPDQAVIGCLSGVLAATVLAAVLPGIVTAAVLGLIGATGSALAKVSLDATIQDDLPEAARASAFGRSETVLQLTWVFGGALGVLLPPTYWIGFTVMSAVLALGLAQTVLYRQGASLLGYLGRWTRLADRFGRGRREPEHTSPLPTEPAGGRSEGATGTT
ncbi:MFS transporter [Gandjariella thermophila]|uniref:MFS transporter n=2 Tax=Gandjariella thermophila TaxID=1931992 RepID=A0A4D4J612_9PSEU|nr:MFS transporter [Gandjariella thermophila]GDY30178.1 MFS transporter [Gandjariella thermophila]